MYRFIIKGGKELSGKVKVSGSKNAALPLIAASLLAKGRTILHNVPDLKDIQTMLKVVHTLGPIFHFENNKIIIDTTHIKSHVAPYELVKTMRASIYVLGPLLARVGKAKVSLPGGCAIGPRPINFHIEAMKKLGARISIKEGFVHARTSKLKGAEIYFEKVSVGATANVLMASVLARGKTVIKDAALEPEIGNLITFLKKMGADIQGKDTDTIIVNGVDNLKPVEYTVIPDRIEAGTFILAGVITRSNITVENIHPTHIRSLIDVLERMNIKLKVTDDSVKIRSCSDIRPIDIKTAPYPGFPTDLQPQLGAVLAAVPGISVINETIFENRYTHVPELIRMGSDIDVEDHIAIIRGKKRLTGAPVMASDLRGGAALVLAALAAKGESVIQRVYHIDRGYEKIESKLKNLGARIERVKN
ncbi:MAG: UDP-N-acetylglucosamine 1-carboxyvinyltransferase [Spirochaetes bacterium]|nr:UDP-N-acetylglucosamine 1-carboxyvinyltransferase [Spirochaetota bacterium]